MYLTVNTNAPTKMLRAAFKYPVSCRVNKHPTRSVPARAHQRATQEEWVQVGEITNSHGVRGEVRVRPTTDFPEDRLEKVIWDFRSMLTT